MSAMRSSAADECSTCNEEELCATGGTKEQYPQGNSRSRSSQKHVNDQSMVRNKASSQECCAGRSALAGSDTRRSTAATMTASRRLQSPAAHSGNRKPYTVTK